MFKYQVLTSLSYFKPSIYAEYRYDHCIMLSVIILYVECHYEQPRYNKNFVCFYENVTNFREFS
jgi:hypothetical protein